MLKKNIYMILGMPSIQLKKNNRKKRVVFPGIQLYTNVSELLSLCLF